MAKLKSDFEKKVRLALLKRDMTIPELAEIIGISVGYLYQLFEEPDYAKNSQKKEAVLKYLNINSENYKVDGTN